MTFDLDATATESDVSTVEGLVQELENQAALLTVVDPRAAGDLAQKVTHGDLGRVDAFAAAPKAVL